MPDYNIPIEETHAAQTLRRRILEVNGLVFYDMAGQTFLNGNHILESVEPLAVDELRLAGFFGPDAQRVRPDPMKAMYPTTQASLFV
jgi:hypothetical protein